MNNSDLNMLVDAVVHVDLADTFMADGDRTVFAPTNLAFEEALDML